MCLAIPGKIVSISGDDPLTRMGKIDFSGVVKEAAWRMCRRWTSAITSSSMSALR